MPEQSNASGGGGNAKYVVIGLLLLGGAVGLYATNSQEPAPAPTPEKPKEVARINPLAQQQLIIEDEEPDAGLPDAGPVEEPAQPKKKRKFAKRGDWDCAGDLAGAAAVINRNRAQVRSCYERRLKVNNILQGDLKLKVKVGASGRVSATSVSGSLRDPKVFSCVRRIAQGWTFNSPTGGSCAVVQVPFRFSPKN